MTESYETGWSFDEAHETWRPPTTPTVPDLRSTANAVLPVGMITAYYGATAPSDWLLCDGAAIPAQYVALIALVGANTPNLKGKVIVGYNAAETEFDTLGETGGAKTVALSTAELASHNHTQNSHNHTQDTHNHTQNSHNHTQDTHSHTQNSHSHTQNAHDHFTNTGGQSQSHFHLATIANVNARNAAHVHAGVGGYVSESPDNPTAVGTVPVNVGNQNQGHAHVITADTPAISTDLATNQTLIATNQGQTATNQTVVATNQSATPTNNTAGSGTAHQNLQPYMAISYIIKAA